MSTAINDGGPAYPVPGDQQDPDFNGASLRDVFAGQAMKAFIGTAGVNCLDGLDGYEDHTAAAAYRMADAMLKARGS